MPWIHERKDAYVVLFVLVICIIGLVYIGVSWYYVKQAAEKLREATPIPRQPAFTVPSAQASSNIPPSEQPET